MNFNDCNQSVVNTDPAECHQRISSHEVNIVNRSDLFERIILELQLNPIGGILDSILVRRLQPDLSKLVIRCGE
jgi:hypothetical protein